MPRRDALTTFAKDLAVTVSGKSDILPLKAALRDIAVGIPIFLYIHVMETFTAAGAAVGTFSIETDDAEAFPSGTLRQTIGTIAANDAAGKVLAVMISPNVLIEAFARLDWAVATGPFTAGKITAYLTPDPSLWRAYKTPIGPTV